MAIDTAAKRRAVASVAVPGAEIAVTPDATPDTFWRFSVGHSYFSGGPAPPSGTGGGDGVLALMSGFPRGTTQLGG